MAAPSQVCSRRERSLLLSLHRDALRYFLDNQSPGGLILDRQSNHGPLRQHGLCSIAATGMGLVALALASLRPHRLITPAEARRRVQKGIDATFALPHTHGVVPHFVDSRTLRPVGIDRRSTIDTAWLLAGALCSAALLNDDQLARRARQLVERVDWDRWVSPSGLISHGHDVSGRALGGVWDRLNAETLILYVMAASGSARVRLPGDKPTTMAGLTFPSAELGLFVSQYSIEMLEIRGELLDAAGLAVDVNRAVSAELADRFVTYRHFWGLSAGDGPGEGRAREGYRAYAPEGPIDGTAHITATLASIAHRPAQVWEQIHRTATCPLPLRGRYGFSNVNLDRGWRSPDVVGIDIGMATLALDNVLFQGRSRQAFSSGESAVRGLRRLGFGVETTLTFHKSAVSA